MNKRPRKLKVMTTIVGESIPVPRPKPARMHTWGDLPTDSQENATIEKNPRRDRLLGNVQQLATGQGFNEGKLDLTRFHISLDDYELGQLIAHGGFGAVYQARCRRTGQTVALKEIFETDTNEDLEKQYKREVAILATTNHPSIMNLLGFTPFKHEGPNNLVIIQPFMEGGSLEAMIQKEIAHEAPPEWTLTQKFIVTYGIACGLMYMHKNRLVHRDLKPHNIFLDHNLEPKIGDFGLSKYVPLGATLEQSIKQSTCHYMAPEYLSDDGKFGFKVDVYAFAITVYRMLTGLELFSGFAAFAVMYQVGLGKRPPIPDTLPEQYKSLIEACWAQQPEERPDFESIVHRLSTKEFLDGLDRRKFAEYQRKVAPDLVSEPDIGRQCPTRNPLANSLDPGQELKKLADTGDAAAQCQYGVFLKHEGNYDLAATYFRLSSDQEYCEGMVRYASCLHCGRGVDRDMGMAYQLCKAAADKGNLHALDKLGTFTYYGDGINRDEVKAAALYKRAADEGYPKAQIHYARLCKEGRGCEMDIDEAVKYTRMAADRAYPKAMTDYATLLRFGEHVPHNITEAVRLYKLAADAGDCDAIYCLCEIYLDGEGTIERNNELAAHYAEKGYSMNDFACTLQWIRCLRAGIRVQMDKRKASELEKRLHSKSYAEYQNRYAYRIHMGQNCRRNEKLAFEYYKMSAENGSVGGMHNLAHFYENGIGCDANIKMAAQWYQQAADAGCAAAQFQMVAILTSGNPYPVDSARSLRYLRLSAEQEFPVAMRTYGILLQESAENEDSLRESVRLLTKAVEKGDQDSVPYLAKAYAEGLGVEKDVCHAAALYTEAICHLTGRSRSKAVLQLIEFKEKLGDSDLSRDIAQQLGDFLKSMGLPDSRALIMTGDK